MKSIIEYLSTFIPPSITVDGYEYQFQLFINHPHYDIRICYTNESLPFNVDAFKYLTENIDSDIDLLNSLKTLRESLRKDGLLIGDYATEEGYTKNKYEEWINNQGK